MKLVKLVNVSGFECGNLNEVVEMYSLEDIKAMKNISEEHIKDLEMCQKRISGCTGFVKSMTEENKFEYVRTADIEVMKEEVLLKMYRNIHTNMIITEEEYKKMVQKEYEEMYDDKTHHLYDEFKGNNKTLEEFNEYMKENDIDSDFEEMKMEKLNDVFAIEVDFQEYDSFNNCKMKKDGKYFICPSEYWYSDGETIAYADDGKLFICKKVYFFNNKSLEELTKEYIFSYLA